VQTPGARQLSTNRLAIVVIVVVFVIVIITILIVE
jgi:hypothetical protein